MNIMETMAQIKSQLEQIELQEQANQQEQVQINQRIVELETELKQQQQRRNQLDQEALKLYTQAEELKPRLRKLKRIANLSKEFLELHEECQDNQDLLNTLYSSVSTQSSEDEKKTHHPIESESSQVKPNDDDTKYAITIDEIKEALPNAEKIYQQLVAGYLEEYKTYQNFIVDGLDLIWYAVAFIAFGRNSYRKMSFRYHPDLDGSELAMQLINTAWSISQNFVNDPTTVNDAMNT
jgi:chromosome segregation ATPase